MAPELDIVEVRLLADAEDPDELVLASVERALAGVRFHPDSQVQDIVIDGAAGLEQLADMAPIHAYEMHSAIAGDRRGRRQRALEEFYEVCARELTRRHRKFGVLDPSPTDNVADADIVGRIQEGHGSLRSTHQASEVIGAAVAHRGSTVSAGSDGSSSKSAVIWSISTGAKPVIEMSRPSTTRRSASSGSSADRSSRSQPAFSAILLSARESARRLASERSRTSIAGTCLRPSSLAAA